MFWKRKMENSDVILRVVPLLILDSLQKGTLFLSYNVNEVSWKYHVIWIVIGLLIFFGACGLFLMYTHWLITTYRFLASGAAIWLSLYFNMWYVKEEIEQDYHGEEIHHILLNANLWYNVAAQIAISRCYNLLALSQHATSQPIKVMLQHLRKLNNGRYSVLLVPVLLRFLYIPPKLLRWSVPICWAPLCVEYVLFIAGNAKNMFLLLWAHYIVTKQRFDDFGIQFFVEDNWTRLKVPLVLRAFFILRTGYVVSNLFMGYYQSANKKEPMGYVKFNTSKVTSPDAISSMLNASNYYRHNETFTIVSDIDTSNINIGNEDPTVIDFIKRLLDDTLVLSCDTTVSLMGLTAVVSNMAHYVGLGLTWYIQSQNEEDRSLGTMTAMLFFVLGLQTGLTGMPPVKRIVRLYRNFFLLFTAVLHFIHGMLNPLLMTLSSSHHHSPHRHLRPLSMCLFLIVFPVVFVYYLWIDQSVSTWLLAVTAFSIEVVLKVVITLLIYGLFMYDAYRDVFWEQLDDYVYYVKACGNSIEFVFGIFLFGNGVWIMTFEAGGTIRAVMLCIHAYFNIWVQAREGWKTFINRRTAVSKINSLPEASAAELENINDVCAICYQELLSARVTRCNHYFHGMCLRKWLYVQDSCPMCHEEIYRPAGRGGSGGGEGVAPAGPPQANGAAGDANAQLAER